MNALLIHVQIRDVASLDKEAFICYLLMSAKDISCSIGF